MPVSLMWEVIHFPWTEWLASNTHTLPMKTERRWELFATINNLLDENPPHVVEAMAKVIPMKRMGKPLEVAQLALYLASPASDYMIGQTLFIDGGMSL